MTVDQQVRDIKTRISQAQAKRARAEFERDNATAAARRARDKLRAEFGVESVEDAKEALVKLETELVQAIDRINEALERTEV